MSVRGRENWEGKTGFKILFIKKMENKKNELSKIMIISSTNRQWISAQKHEGIFSTETYNGFKYLYNN